MPAAANAGDADTPRRGRPRDPARDEAILAAARSLLMESGYARLSMEAIARAAGVAKTTVYRRYASVGEIVGEALFAHLPEAVSLPDTGSLRGDLEQVLEAIAAVLDSDQVRDALPGLMGDLGSDQAVQTALRERLVGDGRERLRALFERAVARGEIRADIDHASVGAALVGALLFRSAIGGLRLERCFIDDLLNLALDGLRPR